MKRAANSVGSTPTSNPNSLLFQLQNTIIFRKIVSHGDVVMVGVSGGPDSVALLHLLHELRSLLGIKIIVAHFNHRMRRESSRDERFVLQMADHLGLKHVCARSKERPPKVGSLEDWARRQRYDFLIRSAKMHKADVIALAHTTDDLAETVLMRVLRGSGLLGLKGMGETQMFQGVRIVRPLLSFKKKDILKYLHGHHLKFCIDKSNAQTDFFRNKIRLKLLPLLNKEYNANIKSVLVGLSQNAAQDYDFLYREAVIVWNKAIVDFSHKKSVLILTVRILRDTHPSLIRIVLRLAYERLKGDMNQLTFDHVAQMERLIADADGSIDLPGGVSVRRESQRMIFYRRSKSGMV